jgi:hypothetical protein
MRFKEGPGIDAVLTGARYMLMNGADALLGPMRRGIARRVAMGNTPQPAAKLSGPFQN